jgi:hypothetical protein
MSMLLPFLALIGATAFAADFAPGPAFDGLRSVIAQAGTAAQFPSCAPEQNRVWCPTNAEAFRRTLPPAARAALETALRGMLAGDVATELRGRVGTDAEGRRQADLLAARAQDPALDVWHHTVDPAAAHSIVVVDYQIPGKLSVSIHLSLTALFDPGAEAAIGRRHSNLICEPELLAWFDRAGNFLELNPYLGSCHDGDE